MESAADVGNFSGDLNWSYVYVPGEISASDVIFERIISCLNVYAIPIIIAVGLIGNTSSFLVYVCTPHMRRQTSSVYLAYLAAIDSCFLICLFVIWFGWVGIHAFQKNGWCHVIIYTSYVCGFLSAWTVISFTFERWVVVFMPLRRHTLCTRRRAILTMVVITSFALAFYSFSLWTTRVRYVGDVPVCTSSPDYHGLLKVMTSVDTIIGVVIPTVAIIVMNTCIGIKLCRYTSRASDSETLPAPLELTDIYSNASSAAGDHLQSSAEADHSVTRPRSWRVLTRRRHTQLRITRALLIVSTVFIVLSSPSYAFRLQALVLSIRGQHLDISLRAYFWQELLHFLHYINFSANFFLYSACSRSFRHALKRLLRRAYTNLKKSTATSRTKHDNTLHPRYK